MRRYNLHVLIYSHSYTHLNDIVDNVNSHFLTAPKLYFVNHLENFVGSRLLGAVAFH